MELGTAAAAHGAATFVAHACQSVAGPALPSLAVTDEDCGYDKQGKGNNQVKDIGCHKYKLSIVGLSAKVITVDIILLHPEIFQHCENRLVHHWRATQVIVDIFRGWMVF